MIAFGHIALLRPWWLLALPLVGLLYFTSKPRGSGLGGWEKAADPRLLAAMVARGAAAGGRFRTPALLVTLLLGILALSGPAVQRQDQDRLRNLDATILVMDVSQDMTGGGAIREAASAAHDVLAHVTARQTALIVYAGDAYIASAFTDFPGAIDADLFSLDDQTVPDPGVRPDRALALAQKMFEEASIINGDVVLITSGGGLEGSAATRQAIALARAGHRLYTMDVSTAAARGKGGATRVAALAALAEAGNGFGVSILKPERLLDTLSNEAINRTGNSAVNALDWRDFGRLLLLLAALPLLLGFRKAATA